MTLAGALLLAGCGGDGGAGERVEPALRGASLVVGSSVEEWSLLVIPRDGGPAELRSLEDPSLTLWTGGSPLPPSVEAHRLGGASAVLRAPDGTIHRYDPALDAVGEVGRVGEGATWTGSDGEGAWADPVGGSVLVVTASGGWRVEAQGRPRWAAPVGDGVAAALVGESGATRLVLLQRAETAAAAAAGDPPSAPAAPPAAVTAWGRRVVATGTDGRSVVVLAVPELEVAGSTELDGPITALAASPSSHRLYVALGGRTARLVAIGRLNGRTDRLGRLEAAAREIRPALYGGYLLVGGDGPAAYIPLEDGDPVPLPGEWRADLPLGLPGGRVLVLGEGGVAEWRPAEGGEGDPTGLDGGAESWWIPVRWRPPRPERVAEGEPSAEVAAGDAATEPAAPGEPAEAPAVAAPPDDPVAERPAAGEPGAGAEGLPGEGSPEAGFYAIVASSQQPAAIVSLARTLDEAGFRSRVQRHRDEASELWYRALVGPYGTRDEAEAAARQLRRERGLQAWIAEVGPDARPQDATP